MNPPPLSLAKSAARRYGQAVFVHNGRVFVYGGEVGTLDGILPPESSDEVLIYDPDSLGWSIQRTTGDVFLPGAIVSVMAAHVLDERLFLFSFRPNNDIDVRTLDLNTFVWKKKNPTSSTATRPPPRLLLGTLSWIHGDSIVFFGGYIDDNQVTNDTLVYNTVTNVWSFPKCKGQIPSPRFLHSSFVIGSRVYVCGGEVAVPEDPLLLHRLDLANWSWKTLTTTTEIGEPLPDMVAHTMTPIDERRRCVFVFRATGEAWMLHLNDDGVGSSGHWIRCGHLDRNGNKQFFRQAVVVPGTGQVWIMGGRSTTQEEPNVERKIVKLTITRPLSLEMLSLVAVRREKEKITMERIEELPQTVLRKFRSYEESKM